MTECSWCGTTLTGLDAEGNARLSNGICLSCLARHFPGILPRFMEARKCNVSVAGG